MVFAYYRNLNTKQKALYRKSDAQAFIYLKEADSLRDIVPFIEESLKAADAKSLKKHIQHLLDRLCLALELPKVQIVVKNIRPHNDQEELHGYYESREEKTVITVWMRTAKRRQIVAFASFFRTILHEFCHHVDFYYFAWGESFHTEGFYKRESSLYKQLVRS